MKKLILLCLLFSDCQNYDNSQGIVILKLSTEDNKKFWYYYHRVSEKTMDNDDMFTDTIIYKVGDTLRFKK